MVHLHRRNEAPFSVLSLSGRTENGSRGKGGFQSAEWCYREYLAHESITVK